MKEMKVKSYNYKFRNFTFNIKATWSAFKISPHHLISRYPDAPRPFNLNALYTICFSLSMAGEI
jgi:hypothetical protein